MREKPRNLPTPAGWLEAVEQGLADLDAGLFVSEEQIHLDIQAEIKELEAVLNSKSKRARRSVG